ncbi:aminoglycoside phosphotransferase family protein [Actinoplanes oblitus]|uniref:Aminoglycoside phosphotransferase family protein n=1 Tax=Actinoplanes oblitus TaxID=3040509 RepID=A0ABY8W635_9ACTN|nr:aminoglycoside phosphotransferase family protein [Actinoplanes oblitus]WIM93291.1 aminoglycoside phosphotransferase family protein [Actinoplanes oblitus]
MDEAEVRDIVGLGMPDYEIDSVVPLGDGLDNYAFEINGHLIVRVRRSHDPEGTAREAGILAAVAAVATVAVPSPAFVLPERSCLAYYKLPGVPLLELPQGFRMAHAEPIVAVLGELLAALHAVRPAGALPDEEPLGEWLREAAALYPAVAAHVPEVYRERIEVFLRAEPPIDDHQLVFSHNDLGIEHVLADDSGKVTGVIDWADAALVDPACDHGRLYRDLGPAALCATDRRLTERAVFYARCGVLEDLAYGVETEKFRYVEKSLTALEWLFPS